MCTNLHIYRVGCTGFAAMHSQMWPGCWFLQPTRVKCPCGLPSCAVLNLLWTLIRMCKHHKAGQDGCLQWGATTPRPNDVDDGGGDDDDDAALMVMVMVMGAYSEVQQHQGQVTEANVIACSIFYLCVPSQLAWWYQDMMYHLACRDLRETRIFRFKVYKYQ